MDDKMATLKSFIDRCFDLNGAFEVTNMHELSLLRNVPFSYTSGYVIACLDLGYISESEHAELIEYIKKARGRM